MYQSVRRLTLRLGLFLYVLLVHVIKSVCFSTPALFWHGWSARKNSFFPLPRAHVYHVFFFCPTGEWMWTRAQALQCNGVPWCSLLSGDGQGPGWTSERMWQVHGAPCYISPLNRSLSYPAVCRSSAMLEESQDGMDSGTLSPASARQVTIQRHPTQGFGFIAGSQRPVIVRSVSAG